MSVDAELIAAVTSAPEDDNPRLVYADHLLQRGDLRGELIGLQCALARADAADEPFEPAMIARERELLAEHAAIWTNPLRAIVDAGYTFRRGFVEHVAAWRDRDVTYRTVTTGVTSVDEIAEIAEDRVDRLGEMMQHAPLLRSLEVRAEALMRPLPPSWANLYSLELTESGYSTPESIMLALRQLTSLRRLQIASASLVDQQAAAFLEHARPLEHLGLHIGWHVSSRPSADLVSERIAYNGALHGLRSLHLAGFELAAPDRLTCLAQLERLAIDRCRVPPENLIALVGKLPRLTMLEYQFTDADTVKLDLRALLAAAPNLRRLALSGIIAERADAVADSGLRRLILDRCSIGDRVANTIVDGLAHAIELQIRNDELSFQTDERVKSHALRWRPTPPDYPREVVELFPANKIMAVKAYRELTGAGLADAKMAVERIDETMSERTAYSFVRARARWCR